MSSIGGLGGCFLTDCTAWKKIINKKSLIKNHKWIKSSTQYIFFIFARPGSASGCFKKATQNPNAGHLIFFKMAQKNIFTLKLFSQAVW
jgi:hypothetical protein